MSNRKLKYIRQITPLPSWEGQGGGSLLLILSLLLLLSCSSGGGSFTLSGKFKGLEQGEFVCYSSSPDWGTFDTVRVQGGTFSITHPLADTVVLTLQYPNFMQTQIIAIPGEEVTVRGNANNMLAIEVGDDDENETLNQFRESVLSQGSAISRQPSAISHLAEQFIREHPASWAAVAVFQKYILEAEHPDYDKISSLLRLMEKQRPQRKVLADMRHQLGALLVCRTGTPLPPFQAVTLRGDTITNATFKGKPLLITFWSTMVPEHTYALTATNRIVKSRTWLSRAESQEAKEKGSPSKLEGVALAPGAYDSQLPSLHGRDEGVGLSNLNICLDPDTTECRRVIRRDTIGGYNVCDLLTFDSPLVRTFGLRALPSNILVDSRGIIRHRDIPLDKLPETLAKNF